MNSISWIFMVYIIFIYKYMLMCDIINCNLPQVDTGSSSVKST